MEIEEASLKHQALIEDFAEECINDSTVNYGRALKDSKEYINYLISRSNWTEESPEGLLPCTTYFAVENSRIIGAIRLRRGQNKNADNLIGYIGFETRPSERKRGVAKTLLNWVVTEILENETIVTCADSNLASKNLLQGFGATYINRVYDFENKIYMLRFKIAPSKK